MTMLEASLRKLVNEEAERAALSASEQFLGTIEKRIKAVTMVSAGEAVAAAIKAIETYNRMERPITGSPSLGPISRGPQFDETLRVVRTRAMELALQHAPESPLPLARTIAQFVLDGEGMDVRDRKAEAA